MRAVIQKVKSASVTVDSKVVSSIGKGLLVLVGVGYDDSEADCEKIAQKVLKLKLWPNDEETAHWKKSVVEVQGEVLCVSQFTLLAVTKKGAKPDFHNAAKGEHAKSLYYKVLDMIANGLPGGSARVGDGVFGAMMDVALVNDGPVTIQLDSKETKSGKATPSPSPANID